MTLCCEWSLVKSWRDFHAADPLYCNSWGCGICHPRRVRKLRRELIAGKPDKFLTITVNPEIGDSPDHRARLLRRAFQLLAKRYKRRWPKAVFEYMATFETTKKGEPHLHIMLRSRYIPQKWISNIMRELINAPVVDIRRIGGQKKRANYVCKYVGKDPGPFEGCKRYWKSRGYTQPEDDEDKEGADPKPVFHVFRGSRLDWMANEGAMGFLAFGGEERAFSKYPGERSSKPPDVQALGARP